MASTPPAPTASANKPKITVSQLRILLEAIETDPTLYRAGNCARVAYLNIDKWIALAEKLNETSDGARVTVQNWKYVLRYWSENTKKKLRRPKDKALPKPVAKLTPDDAEELAALEKRLFEFINKEETKEKEKVDVTYFGTLSGDPKSGDDNDQNPGPTGVKFVAQLKNVYMTKPDENTFPDGAKKRTIIMKEGDASDPRNTKKFKIIFNENLTDGDPERQILENQLDRMQIVSRGLEDHISAVQSRIHMIKDLWKHRCGDN